MELSFSYDQIQKVNCLLCSKCLFSEEKREQLLSEKIPCIIAPTSADETCNSEVFATCLWLYADEPAIDGYFDEDFFVVSETYLATLKSKL